MKFYCLASNSHWIDHLAPVWKALDESERGAFYTTPRNLEYARSLVGRVIPFPAWTRPERGALTIVASEGDRAKMAPFQVIRFEHGIGGSFHGGSTLPDMPVPGRPNLAIRAQRRNPSYAGGDRQRNVKAFLNPNHYSNDRWMEAYPRVPSFIVGTPKMDPWFFEPPKLRSDPPTVCISFHFEATVMPETRSAFRHFSSIIPELKCRTDIELVGHAHPKFRNELEPYYAEHGIEFLRHFNEVMDRADVYIVDSFSTLYEFAALDRPVVILNAPWFRRDVHHGLRFWEHSDIGPIANHPRELSAAIDLALEDLPEHQERRRVATEALYPYRGMATEQAVETLRRVAYEREGVPAP